VKLRWAYFPGRLMFSKASGGLIFQIGLYLVKASGRPIFQAGLYCKCSKDLFSDKEI